MARIAIVTSSFPEGPGDASGHFVLSEVNLLCEAGHDVVVLAPGAAPKHLPANAFKTHWLGPLEAFGWPGLPTRLREHPSRALSVAQFAWRVRKALQALGPLDRIIAHWLFPSGALLLFAPRTEWEIVAHGSDIELLHRLPSWLSGPFLNTLKKRGCKLRFVSKAQHAKTAAHFGNTLPESYVRPCTLDVSALARTATEEALALGQNRPIIAIVSRLVPEKRVATALRAATLIPNAQVVVAGDGPLRESLEAAFPEAHFVGRLPRPLALGLIAAADVLVHASELEGASSVVREARALGTPVVAANSGDLLAMSQHDKGLFVLSSREARGA